MLNVRENRKNKNTEQTQQKGKSYGECLHMITSYKPYTQNTPITSWKRGTSASVLTLVPAWVTHCM